MQKWSQKYKSNAKTQDNMSILCRKNAQKQPRRDGKCKKRHTAMQNDHKNAILCRKEMQDGQKRMKNVHKDAQADAKGAPKRKRNAQKTIKPRELCKTMWNCTYKGKRNAKHVHKKM